MTNRNNARLSTKDSENQPLGAGDQVDVNDETKNRVGSGDDTPRRQDVPEKTDHNNGIALPDDEIDDGGVLCI